MGFALELDRKGKEMHEFTCGHQECDSRLISSDKDILMGQVADHLKVVHNVQTATRTILNYLETACVTSSPDW